MAEDDPGSDEDAIRAIIALRSMDEARRRKMVEKLEKMARTHPRVKPAQLKLVKKNDRNDKP